MPNFCSLPHSPNSPLPITFLSTRPTVSLCYQPNSTRRTSGHCLENFRAIKFVDCPLFIITIIIICKHRSVEQMADKRGFVRRNRGLFNSNTGPRHTNKKLQEIYFEAGRHRWAELCRICGKESETIQHITAACEQLAPTDYVKRHDGPGKVIHQKLAEAAKLIEDKSPYIKYTPDNVMENEHFKLYWSRSILTDQTIPLIDRT